MGVQVGIVISGGNIFRGLSGAAKGYDRVKGDQMGMLATVINSQALSSALSAIGQKIRFTQLLEWSPLVSIIQNGKQLKHLKGWCSYYLGWNR